MNKYKRNIKEKELEKDIVVVQGKTVLGPLVRHKWERKNASLMFDMGATQPRLGVPAYIYFDWN